MKKVTKIFLASVLYLSISYSQTHLFVNPGIKAGYAFGENGGFVFGYEISIVLFSQKDQNTRYGLVIDYDFVQDMKRLHIGFEYMYRLVGIDVGPSFAWNKSQNMNGFGINTFGGWMLLGNYNYTYFNKENSFHELGSYLKLPLGEMY